MKKTPFVIVIILLVGISFLMTEKKNSPFKIEGISYNEGENVFYVNSRGGHADEFYRISNDILSKKAEVEIHKACMSSCAEYFLPAAKSLRFVDYPIIGMHGNPITNRIIYQQYSEDPMSCSYTAAANLLELQSNANVPFSYNTFQIETLELMPPEKSMVIQGCQTYNIQFKNYMWLPTSRQLRESMLLEFEGGTCADNLNNCKERIDKRWLRGTRLIIGDELYISKGAK